MLSKRRSLCYARVQVQVQVQVRVQLQVLLQGSLRDWLAGTVAWRRIIAMDRSA